VIISYEIQQIQPTAIKQCIPQTPVEKLVAHRLVLTYEIQSPSNSKKLQQFAQLSDYVILQQN